MRRDPKEFRERFLRWKAGELVYKDGLPAYEGGKESRKVDWKRWDNAELTSYPVPFIDEKRITLTNAGRATGAVLSTNLLDSIADNADIAGLPLLTALGLAVKESTLGNPTDDRSAWNLSSGIRQAFNNKYPGTALHINYWGDALNEREDVINYHKGHLSDDPASGHKSVLLEAFEFYKLHPDKYNTGQKGYQTAVNKRGVEVMQSPEIKRWKNAYDTKKKLLNSMWNRLLPLLKSSKFNLPKYEDGKESNYFRPNGNQIKIDENTGELVDLVNGERGTLQLPLVTVTVRDPKNCRSAYNPNLTVEGFNALTLGGLNNLSPTQWVRRFYDAPKLFSGDMSFSDYTNRWLNGNEGIVTRQFAKNHPYYSAAINMAGDIGSLLALKNIPAALRFIDRDFVLQKNILSLTDNTMTRYIGTGDSGYKDALMSDVIRGNINPPRFSAAQLAKLRRRFKDTLSEDDFRDLASNNIRSEEQFNRINNILLNANFSKKVGRFNFGEDYSLANSWEEYLQDNARNQNLVLQQAYMQSFSKSKEINDWIKNWRVSTDKNIAKGHPLPTFALSDEVLTNSRLFPGDYAIQIKNADKYARTAEAFGHFKEHPTTYRPMSPFEEDVTMFRRRDGLLTGHKYMVKVPKSQMIKDKNLYTSNPAYVADPIIRNGLGVDYNKLINMLFNGVRDLLKLQVLPFLQNIQTMKSE